MIGTEDALLLCCKSTNVLMLWKMIIGSHQVEYIMHLNLEISKATEHILIHCLVLMHLRFSDFMRMPTSLSRIKSQMPSWPQFFLFSPEWLQSAEARLPTRSFSLSVRRLRSCYQRRLKKPQERKNYLRETRKDYSLPSRLC